MGFLTRFDTNRAVQAQKRVEISDFESRGNDYLFRENKGADRHGYHATDLCL